MNALYDTMKPPPRFTQALSQAFAFGIQTQLNTTLVWLTKMMRRKKQIRLAVLHVTRPWMSFVGILAFYACFSARNIYQAYACHCPAASAGIFLSPSEVTDAVGLPHSGRHALWQPAFLADYCPLLLNLATNSLRHRQLLYESALSV